MCFWSFYSNANCSALAFISLAHVYGQCRLWDTLQQLMHTGADSLCLVLFFFNCSCRWLLLWQHSARPLSS